MAKRYWVRLNERPDVIERLRQLPEGSKLNFIGNEHKPFLRIEGKELVLLDEAGLGNMVPDPIEEYFLFEQVSYNIEEDAEGDVFAITHQDYNPRKINPWRDREKIERYVKILKETGRTS